MIAAIVFSDEQLAMVTRAAATLPPDGDARRILLERVASRLELCGHFKDSDVEATVCAVLAELRPRTARDVYLEEIARNPNWHEAPGTGECVGIGGAKAF